METNKQTSRLLENCQVLKAAYGLASAESYDLNAPPVVPGISLLHADALYRFVREHKPMTCVEVGMANAVSSVAILQALKENGAGRLISIDPFQHTLFAGRGLDLVRQCGLADQHELMVEPDFQALPALLKSGTSVDFAYIDGWHTFDYVMLDFWYLDKMMPKGGAVAFNDAGMQAIAKVIEFVRSHRKYEELEVLPRDYLAAGWYRRLYRRLRDLRTNDRYFRKTEKWEPDWNFYRSF